MFQIIKSFLKLKIVCSSIRIEWFDKIIIMSNFKAFELPDSEKVDSLKHSNAIIDELYDKMFTVKPSNCMTSIVEAYDYMASNVVTPDNKPVNVTRCKVMYSDCQY